MSNKFNCQFCISNKKLEITFEKIKYKIVLYKLSRKLYNKKNLNIVFLI